eukprot:CAMPEP_0117419168 /NCGR_PEP_ID=MMETSP0758-20121206/793_1 /TAXON_ID=63605 /ORGANISM="Percolomonas cosmopolitus, Strain AE-1 (ATCC 50343)" /LENGTH=239 /DNA_ID=CAMNT_0005200089 /DNA_START=227 /DNA_END=943 /DNA_ORIENTATION=+
MSMNAAVVFDNCLSVQNTSIIEPIDHLFNALSLIYPNSTLPDLIETVDSVNRELIHTDPFLTYGLPLSDDADYSTLTSIGKENRSIAQLLLGSYHVSLVHLISKSMDKIEDTETSHDAEPKPFPISSEEDMNNIDSIFQMYMKVYDQATKRSAVKGSTSFKVVKKDMPTFSLESFCDLIRLISSSRTDAFLFKGDSFDKLILTSCRDSINELYARAKLELDILSILDKHMMSLSAITFW